MNHSQRGLIVVLGSPNGEKGELFNIAVERCNLALKEYKKHSDWKLLLTGGFGDHFNRTDKPHAHYLKEYLVSKGIPENSFLEFALSKSTIEDAELTKNIALNNQAGHILIITSDHHFDRADYIFEKIFEDTDVRICFSICKTDRYKCGIDLDSQIEHEKNSLAKLKVANENLGNNQK